MSSFYACIIYCRSSRRRARATDARACLCVLSASIAFQILSEELSKYLRIPFLRPAHSINSTSLVHKPCLVNCSGKCRTEAPFTGAFRTAYLVRAYARPRISC